MQNNAESYIDNNHKSLRVFLYAQRVMKGWNQNIQEENVFKLEKDIGDGALRKLIKHNGERHKVLNLTTILVRSAFKWAIPEVKGKANPYPYHSTSEEDFWASWKRSPKCD